MIYSYRELQYKEEFDEDSFELSPLEFKKALEQDSAAVLVDVREQYEWDICYIDGARLLPTSSFDPATSGLNKEASIYLYCYKGSAFNDGTEGAMERWLQKS